MGFESLEAQIDSALIPRIRIPGGIEAYECYNEVDDTVQSSFKYLHNYGPYFSGDHFECNYVANPQKEQLELQKFVVNSLGSFVGGLMNIRLDSDASTLCNL